MISYEMLVGAAQSRNRICRRRHRRFMLHIPQTQFPEQSGRRRRRRCYCRLAQLAGICDFPSPCFRKEEDHCGMKILQWRNFVFHIPPFLPSFLPSSISLRGMGSLGAMDNPKVPLTFSFRSSPQSPPHAPCAPTRRVCRKEKARGKTQ